MLSAAIKAIEYHLPEKILDNEALAAEFPDWNVAKIFDKTGIDVRHIAGEGETALDLAERAARKLFESGAAAPGEIDALIMCTQSPDYVLPPNSPQLQHRLGLPRSVMAFDIAHGCSGYVYLLALAQALAAGGQARTILALTGETYSKHINPADRSVRTIFGDGASATLIRAGESDRPGLGPFVFDTDGGGAENLIVPKSGAAAGRADAQTFAAALADGSRTLDDLYMNGPEIFTFSMSVVPALVKKALAVSGRALDDLDGVVFHQANKMMLDSLRRRAGVPEDKFITHYEFCGNTVSATIPIALKTALERGRIGTGQRLLLAGFGVGYSSAAGLVEI